MVNSESAAHTGQEVDNGVVVNGYLVTADPQISAVGDCASYDPGGDAPRRLLESMQDAVHQHLCIAAYLTVASTSFVAVPWF